MLRRIRLIALLAGLVLFPISAPADEEKRITLLLVNDHYTIDAVDGGKRGGSPAWGLSSSRSGLQTRRLSSSTPATSSLHRWSPSSSAANRWSAPTTPLGLTAATFGNHEFDFGDAILRQRMKESRFAWVSSNVYDKATGQPFGGAVPWIVREVRGVKVGILGLTPARNFHHVVPLEAGGVPGSVRRWAPGCCRTEEAGRLRHRRRYAPRGCHGREARPRSSRNHGHPWRARARADPAGKRAASSS